MAGFQQLVELETANLWFIQHFLPRKREVLIQTQQSQQTPQIKIEVAILPTAILTDASTGLTYSVMFPWQPRCSLNWSRNFHRSKIR